MTKFVLTVRCEKTYSGVAMQPQYMVVVDSDNEISKFENSLSDDYYVDEVQECMTPSQFREEVL